MGDSSYATNSKSSHTVSVIATASNTVVQTITVGPSPIGIATTGDGRFVLRGKSWLQQRLGHRQGQPASTRPATQLHRCGPRSTAWRSSPWLWPSRGRLPAPKRKPQVRCSSTARMPNGVGAEVNIHAAPPIQRGDLVRTRRFRRTRTLPEKPRRPCAVRTTFRALGQADARAGAEMTIHRHHQSRCHGSERRRAEPARSTRLRQRLP